MGPVRATAKGLAGSSKVRYGRRDGRISSSRTIRVNDSVARREKDIQSEREHLGGLSFEAREALLQMDVDTAATDSNCDAPNEENEQLPLPPGEESMFTSHAGGQEEVLGSLLQQAAPGSTPLKSDYRSRRQRILVRTAAWQEQMPELVTGYLEWQQHSSDPHSNATTRTDPEGREFNIMVVDTFERRITSFPLDENSMHPNVNMMRRGSIGCAPRSPTVAITLHTLDMYRQTHRVCPRLSIYAFVKALCHLHSEPFHRYLVNQFSIAFDVYLEVHHRVDERVNAFMKHDTPNYRMLNACPPCLYKLEDEPPLAFSMIATIDGNQSLKLVDDAIRAGKERPDDRQARTDRWLTAAQVNVFQDDVKNSRSKAPIVTPSSSPPSQSSHPTQQASLSESLAGPSAGPSRRPPLPASSVLLPSCPPSSLPHATPAPLDSVPVSQGDARPTADVTDESEADVAWLNINEEEPVSDGVAICVERWKNAGSEARKSMFSLFAICGLFIASCRHGHILIMCDMVRSGELMKYPLAIVDKLIEVYGADMALGYDIACAFMKTVERSQLGPRAKAFRLRGIVPAFHGHAHNRACQVWWHPMYIEGIGMEDLECCERVFSDSNGLAPGTRLATAFHRTQAIEQHFAFVDIDKYAESGNFIYNNYRQALQVLQSSGQQLEALEVTLGTTALDYDRYLMAEREYLRNLKVEPPATLMTIQYMEALEGLQKAGAAKQDAHAKIMRLDYDIIHNGIQRVEIARRRTKHTNSISACISHEEKVAALEDQMEIETRWTSTSAEFISATAELGRRKYRLALDNLERLVVQRLFELTKLGLSGLGYKLREKLGHALKARAQAIRTALDEYNRRAIALQPPRPTLTWAKVVETVALADFDLLRDSRNDIRGLEWAQPANRDAMRHHFACQRAREELQRLNVETQRLLTSMYDQHVDYYRAISSSIITQPSLAFELTQRWQKYDRINSVIAHRLLQTSQLQGFSGSFTSGVRIGRDVHLSEGVPLPSWAGANEYRGNGASCDDEAGEENEDDEAAGGMVDFVHGLS